MTTSNAREHLRATLIGAREIARAGKVTQVSEKGALDYVTNIDREIDAHLTKSLPSVAAGAVFSEERPMEGFDGKQQSWLIDPLDGTHNLKVGLPFFGISAALFGGGSVSLAGVCDVASGEVYIAERGAGAWLNGERLRVPHSHAGLIGLSTGALDSLVRNPDGYACLRAWGKIRNMGAQTLHLCYVARGRFALTASYEARLWDDAAGRLIAEEAGARYVTYGRAQMTAEGATQKAKSVCAHPAVFEESAALFGQMWRAEDE
jgi:myo-inositol-1(or 4)-monophosphatase